MRGSADCPLVNPTDGRPVGCDAVLDAHLPNVCFVINRKRTITKYRVRLRVACHDRSSHGAATVASATPRVRSPTPRRVRNRPLVNTPTAVGWRLRRASPTRRRRSPSSPRRRSHAHTCRDVQPWRPRSREPHWSCATWRPHRRSFHPPTRPSRACEHRGRNRR